MRIWLQIPTVAAQSSLFDNLVADHVATVAGPDTTVDIHPLPPDTYASAISEHLVVQDEDRACRAHYFASTAAIAEQHGYNAWISGAEEDPGLAIAAQTTGISVIGYGHNTWKLAHTHHYRLGMIGFRDALSEPIISNIVAAGADLASYQVIADGPLLVQQALTENFDPLVQAYTVAATRAAAAGAQWLVSAEPLAHEILIHLSVRELAGLPLIDQLGLAIATAEHLHRLRALDIIARPDTSHIGRPICRPDSQVVYERNARVAA